MRTFISTLIIAVVAMACQMQEEPVQLTDAASSGNGTQTTAASYTNSYSFSPDGKTLTLTITGADAGAKKISHLNFKFNACDGSALTVSNITGATANGADVMGKLGSVEGKGGDCFGMLADPFVKLDQGIELPAVVVITFDAAVSGGQFLLKTGSANSPTGGGCFGLNDPNYSFSRSCASVAKCYSNGDTGWATGPRYVGRGNWATYTPYQAGTVNIYAGQTKFAGTATMSAVTNGNVTITIVLNSTWSLQDVSNPIKIQGYTVAPSGNPSPGRFASKGTSLTATVPAANFYGIHLDLKQEVDCE